jgi:hypothetical protein
MRIPGQINPSWTFIIAYSGDADHYSGMMTISIPG